MRKVILYSAVSLDGFIAGPDHDMNWLEKPEYTLKDEHFGFKDLCERCDTSLCGNGTLEVVTQLTDEFPFPTERSVVFTRTPGRSFKGIEFVTDDVVDYTRKLLNEPGKDIWLVGGSQINGQLLDAGLIDELILTIIPTVLSGGVPLFAGNQKPADFQLVSTKDYPNGFVILTYHKR